jgi:hypothetical protein
MAKTSTTAADTLARLTDAGLTIDLDEHRLSIGPRRLLTPALRRRIARHLVDLRELVRATGLPDDLAPATAAVLAAAGPGWLTAEGLKEKTGRSAPATRDALALLVGRGLVLTHPGAVPIGRGGAGGQRPVALYRDARLGTYGTVLRARKEEEEDAERRQPDDDGRGAHRPGDRSPVAGAGDGVGTA